MLNMQDWISPEPLNDFLSRQRVKEGDIIFLDEPVMIYDKLGEEGVKHTLDFLLNKMRVMSVIIVEQTEEISFKKAYPIEEYLKTVLVYRKVAKQLGKGIDGYVFHTPLIPPGLAAEFCRKEGMPDPLIKYFVENFPLTIYVLNQMGFRRTKDDLLWEWNNLINDYHHNGLTSEQIQQTNLKILIDLLKWRVRRKIKELKYDF